MSARVRLLNVLGGVITLLILGGCGDSPSDNTTSGPLEGREISRASQLEGTWLGTNQGDFIGFEFMADGKVLATPVTAAMTGFGGVMYSYSILDGGRLSLVAPNGQTQIYGVTLSGDQMELSGFMMLSSTNSQRFRRLPDGQTLEQGIAEQDRLDAEAYRARYDALTKYLQRKDLVMTPTTPSPNAPSAIALELVAGATGRGWYDDAPPHLDEITARIDTADNDPSQPALHITFGAQIDPPPQQARSGGQIVFNSSGDMDSPRLIASVTYGGQSFELEIRRDADLYREIVGRFDAEKERIAALRAPLLAALKDYAVIDGRSGAQVANQATQDHFVLVRDPATGAFAGEGTLTYENRAPQLQQITADVAVFGDQAMLLINGFYRQYQLTLANASTGELTGAWYPSGQQNGWQTSLAISEAIDAAERERRAEAQRKALRNLSATTSYFGRVAVLQDQWGAARPFVILTVKPDAGGTFAATARYPSLRMDVRMQGNIVESITGPALQLRYGGSEIESSMAGMLALAQVERQLQNQVWSLTLAEPGNGGSLLTGAGTGMGTVSLEPMTDAWKQRQLDTVRKTLAAGADFNAWAAIYKDQPATVFKFKLDPASGVLNGVVPERSGPMNIWPGQTFEGKYVEQDGIAAGEFTYDFNRNRDYTMNWWAYVGPDDSILLIGNFGQISTGRERSPGFEMVLAR